VAEINGRRTVRTSLFIKLIGLNFSGFNLALIASGFQSFIQKIKDYQKAKTYNYTDQKKQNCFHKILVLRIARLNKAVIHLPCLILLLGMFPPSGGWLGFMTLDIHLCHADCTRYRHNDGFRIGDPVPPKIRREGFGVYK
jgi:hypothetical protein